MERCVFNDACPFLKEKVTDMPLTTRDLVEDYCKGTFTACTIHKIAIVHGIDKVPHYVYPDDKYELSNRIIDLVLSDKSSW